MSVLAKKMHNQRFELTLRTQKVRMQTGRINTGTKNGHMGEGAFSSLANYIIKGAGAVILISINVAQRQ